MIDWNDIKIRLTNIIEENQLFLGEDSADFILLDVFLANKLTKQAIFDGFCLNQGVYILIIKNAVEAEEYEIAALAKTILDDNIEIVNQTLQQHKEHNKMDRFHLIEMTRIMYDNVEKLIESENDDK